MIIFLTKSESELVAAAAVKVLAAWESVEEAFKSGVLGAKVVKVLEALESVVEAVKSFVVVSKKWKKNLKTEKRIWSGRCLTSMMYDVEGRLQLL